MGPILVPLDGSETAEHALGLATLLARSMNRPLVFAQVIPKSWRVDVPGDLTILIQRGARRYLDTVAARTAPTPAASHVLEGNPADELLAFARAHDALLVMSTHGRGGIDRVISGSVADKVVRGTTIPVVVVPRGATSAAPAIEDVLAPLDGSEFAEAALPQAIALAQATGATLRLLRVVEPIWSTLFIYGDPMGYYLSDGQLKEMQDEADRAAGNYLTAVAAKLSADLPRVTTSVYHGRPADELLRSAALYPHGHMVMATHGRGGLRRFALGSVTTELLQRSTLPIMVVPSSASASS